MTEPFSPSRRFLLFHGDKDEIGKGCNSSALVEGLGKTETPAASMTICNLRSLMKLTLVGAGQQHTGGTPGSRLFLFFSQSSGRAKQLPLRVRWESCPPISRVDLKTQVQLTGVHPITRPRGQIGNSGTRRYVDLLSARTIKQPFLITNPQRSIQPLGK